MSFDGNVKQYLLKSLSAKKGLLFILIDPLDHPSPDSAVQAAVIAAESGADAILVGGSIGVQGEFLDYVTKNIKQSISKPIILFPGNISTISKYADAIYFMSLLNSHSTYWVAGAQMQASAFIKKLGIQTISVGYTVVEPGGTVGFVGEANLIPRSKPQIAAAYGLTSELFGFDFFITDSGSNAPSPVSPEFAKTVSGLISIPYVVAGGVKTPEQAKELIEAGADVLHVGTAVESGDEDAIKQKIKALSTAISEGAKNKKPKKTK